MQIIELIYGTYMATEVAYYTYIYAKVEKEHYQKVTSHTRAAIMAGRFIAAVSSQILVELNWMNYRDLNYISLSAQILATLWALFLPKVTTSLYFHRRRHTETSNLVQPPGTATAMSEPSSSANGGIVAKGPPAAAPTLGAMKLLWTHFTNSYSKRKVREWSLWYAMGMCGYLQIITYVQVVWNSIAGEVSDMKRATIEIIILFLLLLSVPFRTSGTGP